MLARRAAAIALERAAAEHGDTAMTKHPRHHHHQRRAVEFLCEPQQTLLDVLRDELGLTGSKEGCALGRLRRLQRHRRRPAGLLLPGAGRRRPRARRSSTIEGIAHGDELHPLQQKFLEHAALQCGICTPGFLVAAKALLDAEPGPDRDRSALLAGRQPLPLHRLRQDHPRRAWTPPPKCGRS